MRRRRLLAVLLVAAAATAGCAQVVEPLDPAAAGSLAAEPITPAIDDPTAAGGEALAFEVRCLDEGDPASPPVGVRWRASSATQGTVAASQGAVEGDGTATWRPPSLAADTYRVAATCLDPATGDRATHTWTVTVEGATAPPEADADRPPPSAGTPPDAQADLDANLTVTVVDVGQGSSIVLQRANWTTVFDTGDRFDASHGALLDHLDRTGVETVDALVVSHPHADHAGGCEAVITEHEVAAFLHPGAAHDTTTWKRCTDTARAHGVPTYTGRSLAPGDTVDLLPDVTFQVLNADPDADSVHEANLALHATFGSFGVTLTGDLECEGENVVLDRGLDVHTTVLTLGHHGSRTSSCDPWLDATRPGLATAGVGADNRYGHPHEEVLDRLAERGIDLYRTDEHGTVTVETDGRDWTVTAAAGAGGNGTVESEPGGTATGEALDVEATVSDPEPCRYSEVTVRITVADGNGTPVEGAATTSTWHYKTTSPTENGTTDAEGEDAHTRNVGGASAGYEVTVDVEAEHGGDRGTASTSFTPRDC